MKKKKKTLRSISSHKIQIQFENCCGKTIFLVDLTRNKLIILQQKKVVFV